MWLIMPSAGLKTGDLNRNNFSQSVLYFSYNISSICYASNILINSGRSVLIAVQIVPNATFKNPLF